jgi:hypothetical protein
MSGDGLELTTREGCGEFERRRTQMAHHSAVKREPLPQPLDGRAFSVRQARALGVPLKRLRASDLEIPFRGVRSGTRPDLIVERCHQYLPRMRDDQFFSHATAALIYGIPLPRELEKRTVLDVTGRSTRPRASGVVGYRSLGTESVIYRRLPVTSPGSLLAELAPILSAEDLIVAGDGLVRRKGPLISLESLQQGCSTGARGSRLARVALASIRSGTDSPMETRLRLILVRAGLPEPVIHHTIYDWKGDFVGTPDLAYVTEKVAIEYEGQHHRDDARVFADDIERRELMQEAGWYVIRVIAHHIHQPLWLADRVARILAERSR